MTIGRLSNAICQIKEKSAETDRPRKAILNKKQINFLLKTNNSSNLLFFHFSLDFTTPFAYNVREKNGFSQNNVFTKTGMG